MTQSHKTVKIDVEIHHRLKLLAVQEGISMAQLIKNLVEQRQSYHEHNEYRCLLQEGHRGRLQNTGNEFTPTVDYSTLVIGTVDSIEILDNTSPQKNP